MQDGTASSEGGVDALDQSEQAQDEECQGAPVNKSGTVYGLMDEDREEGPCEDGCSSGITFFTGKSVATRGGLKEDKRQEDENLGEHTRFVVMSVNSERLESADNNKNDGPPVP